MIFKFEDAENEIKTWTAQKNYQRNVLLNTDNLINDRVYEDISTEEELYAFKKKIARDLMKKQQEAFYTKQQNIL